MHILDGVTVPVVTSLDSELRPDPAAALPLLEALAAAGVTRVMFFGTNGEGALLNPHHSGDYLAEVVAAWRALVGEDAVVTAAAFGAGTRETVNRARIFAESSPDAIVVPPPNYFVHTAAELEFHYAQLDSVGVPIVAYNAPRYTGNPITATVLQTIADFDHIVGLKDSGGDDTLLDAALDIASTHEHFAVSQGNEHRMAWAVERGAAGITPGLGNIAPGPCLELFEAARSGDVERAAALQDQLSTLTGLHSPRPGVAAMKAALHSVGLGALRVSTPLRPYNDNESAIQREFLVSWPGRLIAPLTERP